MQQAYEEDWPNLPIKYLVVAADDYIVFIDHENDIDWQTKDSLEHQDIDKHNAIINKAVFLESIPCNHFEEKTIINYKRMIGEAYCRCFENDYQNADAMLQYAKQFIQARSAESSRLWYLTASGATTLFFTILGVLIWIFRKTVIAVVGKFAVVLFMSIVAGSQGAFLSVVMRIGN